MHQEVEMISDISKLSSEYTVSALSDCLSDQLENGENTCYRGREPGQAMAVLAKAAFVRGLVEREGLTLRQAVRELGVRMRRLAD
jgi:hypothetical protein